MAGNTVYVQGSYVDVHDNEVVNLSIDKAGEVKVGDNQQIRDVAASVRQDGAEGQRTEELFHFVHPELDETEAWRIHDAVKRVVKLQGIQMICQYLTQLKGEKKVLLPPIPSPAYTELVRMGMPDGEGFNETTFRKYYNK
jgi:hypothetical protein